MGIDMKLTVEKGRPESDEGRSRKEIAVYDYLDKLGMLWGRRFVKISSLPIVNTAFITFL